MRSRFWNASLQTRDSHYRRGRWLLLVGGKGSPETSKPAGAVTGRGWTVSETSDYHFDGDPLS